MVKFKAAFKFYFLEGFLAKSYLITLFIMCGGVFLLCSLGNINLQQKSEIALINESSYTINTKAIEEKHDSIKVVIHKKEALDSLRDEVKKHKLDGIFVITEKDGKPVLRESYNTFSNISIRMILTQELQTQYTQKVIATSNVNPDTVAKLFATVDVEEDVVKDASQTFGVVYIFVFLMYILIIVFGQSIGSSIASEKSSRVSEVMISKIKPIILLYAKITSMLTLALVQITAIGASYYLCQLAGIVDSDKLSIFGGMIIDLSTITPFILSMFVVYFLLGYLLYATLFAAAGALVSRVEDLQIASMPLLLLIVASFLVGMFSLTNPSHLVVVICSYIPFFSPIVTFSRIVAGEAGLLEIGMTITLMVGLFVGLNRFVSRIYLNGIMNYNEKFSWRSVVTFSKRQ